MNEIAQKRIRELLIEAMKKEKLTQSKVCEMFGFKHPNYISWATKPENADKCPKAVWDALKKWGNSGQSIRGYCAKIEPHTGRKHYESPIPEPERTTEQIKEERLFDNIRGQGVDITKDDMWFNSIIWCMNKAAERGLDLRISITKKEK